MINIGLLSDEPPRPGEWVLIHVGFALSKIDEAEAAAAMEFLEEIGQRDVQGWRRYANSRINGGVFDMRFVNEFRDADKAHALAAVALCEPGRRSD